MAESTFQTLCEEDAIERIVKTVARAKAGEAPFALVLGAGFSYGLVPTARELVTESLPLWVSSLTDGQPYEDLQNSSAADRAKIARIFWERFSKDNQRHGLNLALNPDTGIPNDYGDAYRCAFNPLYVGAVVNQQRLASFSARSCDLTFPASTPHISC